MRSSYYLEDAATEFDVQGLELDWACVTWDGDFRHSGREWEHWGFKGTKWKRLRNEQRQVHLKNAYRVPPDPGAAGDGDRRARGRSA